MTSLPSGAESVGKQSQTGWTGPAELNYLLQQVRTARANIEALRTQTRSLASNPEQLRLLDCLEQYVAALEARHLPVPPTIRDELALQRCLVSRRGVGRPSATQRQADRS